MPIQNLKGQSGAGFAWIKGSNVPEAMWSGYDRICQGMGGAGRVVVRLCGFAKESCRWGYHKTPQWFQENCAHKVDALRARVDSLQRTVQERVPDAWRRRVHIAGKNMIGGSFSWVRSFFVMTPQERAAALFRRNAQAVRGQALLLQEQEKNCAELQVLFAEGGALAGGGSGKELGEYRESIKERLKGLGEEERRLQILRAGADEALPWQEEDVVNGVARVAAAAIVVVAGCWATLKTF